MAIRGGRNLLVPATIAAAVVAMIAAFLPWAKADVTVLSINLYSTEVDGMDRDGAFTLIMGAAVVGLALAPSFSDVSARHTSVIIAILGAGIALIGFLTWIDIEGAIDVDGRELESLPIVNASPAIGLFLTTGSGVAAALLGLAGIRFAEVPPAKDSGL